MEGNPLAVFPSASEMNEALMQKIARELNLSETAFVLPSSREGCAARVRIFTPFKEMTFAGHPTIGASYVLLEEGLVPKTSHDFFLDEQVGPVPIRVERGASPLIWLSTPPIRQGACYDPALCARVLGLAESDLLAPQPQLLDAGNPTIFVALRNKEAVDRAWLDMAGCIELRGSLAEPMCVFVFTPTPECAYSRMFAPQYGIPEDPATGSSTGPLAAFMLRHKLISGKAGMRFISEQGTKMGRRSILHILLRGKDGAEGIDVGGQVVPLIEATLTF
jgi:trans-2,3-dihydro-3-hydroxyanthranilate isomerase